MAHFSCFPGASALSDFRQTRLLDALKQIDGDIVAVRGQYLHFVNAHEPLTADDEARIGALMHYGAPFEPAAEKGATETFVVLPRFGTVSPMAAPRSSARTSNWASRSPTTRSTTSSTRSSSSSATRPTSN